LPLSFIYDVTQRWYSHWKKSAFPPYVIFMMKKRVTVRLGYL